MNYNPFDIKNLSEEDIIKHIKRLIDSCNEREDISGLSENVIKMADVLYLYGELYSRYQKELALIKYHNDTKEVALAYKKKGKSNEKLPMAYWNNIAKTEMEEDFKKEVDAQLNVNRLKYAYEATQEKINTIKKKIDSKKYDL